VLDLSDTAALEGLGVPVFAETRRIPEADGRLHSELALESPDHNGRALRGAFGAAGAGERGDGGGQREPEPREPNTRKRGLGVVIGV